MKELVKVTEETAVQPRPSVPVLIGLGELADLLEGQIARQTIYRWRTERNGNAPVMPPPHCVVSKTPVWTEDVVLGVIADRGLKPNQKALARIRRAQKAIAN